jgi:uncharacterized protein YigA (DUF484 family)
LLGSISLPHPHGGRAISLIERQMMALREKNKVLESKLVELVRFGQENDAIVERMQRWTRGLLLMRNTRQLPDALTTSLAEIFAVPHIALRVWEATDDYAELAATAPVPVELIKRANQLNSPFVGAASEANAAALALLGASGTQSLALIPLRRGAALEAFGLIVLGSPDARRFHGTMGTEVLARVGETASAALSRLLA